MMGDTEALECTAESATITDECKSLESALGTQCKTTLVQHWLWEMWNNRMSMLLPYERAYTACMAMAEDEEDTSQYL